MSDRYARISCPIHGIPDCSPLLNGCSIPRILAHYCGAAYAEGYTDGFSDKEALEIPSNNEKDGDEHSV